MCCLAIFLKIKIIIIYISLHINFNSFNKEIVYNTNLKLVKTHLWQEL